MVSASRLFTQVGEFIESNDEGQILQRRLSIVAFLGNRSAVSA